MQFFQAFRQRVRSKRIYLIAILALLAAVAGLVVGRKYVRSVSIVTGPSMAPTYEEGSRVFTAPILGSVNRGDVVV
jgi:signal peptidase I